MLTIAVALLAGAGVAGARSAPTVVTTARMDYGGRVGSTLATTRRYALYMSTHDKRDRSRCSGACLQAFKPLGTSGGAVAARGSGLNGKLLGVIRRSDGKLQVTYNHHPLYTSRSVYEQPGSAGSQACEESSGGIWYVLDRRGNPLKTPAVLCQGY